MRPANGSATVFHTNSAAGPRVRGRDRHVVVRSWRRGLERPLGRRRHVARRSRRAAAACRCWRSPTCRAAGRCAPAATPRLQARRPALPASACPTRRTSPSAHRRPRRPSRSARRARPARAGSSSAGIAPSVGLPLPSVGERQRLHRDQIDDAAKVLLLADRQLNRDDGAAEHAAQRFERALEAGALAIEAVEDDQARQLRAPRRSPRPSRSTPRRRRRRRRRRARHRRRAARRACRSGSSPCPACR